MEDHEESTPKDASYVIRVALDGIGRGTDPSDLRAELALLHPDHDVFPAEVLLELAADAIDESGASRLAPMEFETLRDHYLPERDAHTRAQHDKSLYGLRAAAIIRAGVDPASSTRSAIGATTISGPGRSTRFSSTSASPPSAPTSHSRLSANESRPATGSPSHADPVRASRWLDRRCHHLGHTPHVSVGVVTRLRAAPWSGWNWDWDNQLEDWGEPGRSRLVHSPPLTAGPPTASPSQLPRPCPTPADRRQPSRARPRPRRIPHRQHPPQRNQDLNVDTLLGPASGP